MYYTQYSRPLHNRHGGTLHSRPLRQVGLDAAWGLRKKNIIPKPQVQKKNYQSQHGWPGDESKLSPTFRVIFLSPLALEAVNRPEMLLGNGKKMAVNL